MKKTFIFVAAAAFLLAPLAAQKIRVVSPNDGGTWIKGSMLSIYYQGTIGQNVKIVLLKANGESAGVVVRDLPTTGLPFIWTVGQTLDGEAPAGSYRIRVAAMDGSARDASDEPFTIVEPAPPVVRELPDYRRPVPHPIGKPKLAVTLINLVRNAGGYSIIFGYKNVGDAALPRRSELTVKPDYRVLIDDREVDKGDLFIPQSPPAAPGWEITTHTGGFIDFPVNEPRPWHIGDQITILLNERNVLNMGTASKTSSLRLIALTCSYDLAFAGAATIDWSANKARVVVTKVGSSPELSKSVTLSYTLGYYHTNTVSGGPGVATVTYPEGPYTVERSMKFPVTGPFPARLDIPMEPSPYYELEFRILPEQRDEFDERNNSLARVRFERPGTPPGPRIHGIAFSTRSDSRGKPTQLRTVITLLNEGAQACAGLRLVLKRNGAQAEEWKGIALAAGQKQLYINYGALPGPPLYNDAFQVYLYDSHGALLDTRSEVE